VDALVEVEVVQVVIVVLFLENHLVVALVLNQL
jgi:hypothetical protein